MKFRPIGKVSMLRLLMAAMAVLMIAAVACTSSTDSGQPTDDSTSEAANSVGQSDGAATNPNANGSGGAETGIAELAPAEQTAEAVFNAATGDLFLEMTSPEAIEVFVTQDTYEFIGRTTVDALVSVNDNVLEVNEEGEFVFEMGLDEGPNVIEIIASNALGEQFDEVLLVIYEPV